MKNKEDIKKELLSTRASVGTGELIRSLHTDLRECWRDLQRQDSWQGLHLVAVVVVAVVVYIQGLDLVEDPDHQPSLHIPGAILSGGWPLLRSSPLATMRIMFRGF